MFVCGRVQFEVWLRMERMRSDNEKAWVKLEVNALEIA
jgi:hypothetical protein